MAKKWLRFRGKDVAIAHVNQPDEKIQASWLRNRFYEASRNGLLPWIANNLDLRDKWVVDAGANIGNHSLFLAGYMGAKVIAFEPVQRHFNQLHRNFQENPGLLIDTDLYNAALGNKNGKVSMKKSDVPPERGGMMMHTVDESGSETEIAKMDTVLKKSGSVEIAYIKIDVEGYQLPTLKGARQTIKKYKPVISVECPTLEEFEEVNVYLGRLGYNPIMNGQKPLILNHTDTYIFQWQDA